MKRTEYGSSARVQLNSGVSKLSRAVKSTLGPSGRNVLIKREGEKPFSTKDGVTVAGEFSSNDPIEQMAIETIQMVSENTDNVTGDGTTTASVLAEYILKRGLDFPDHLNLLDIKRGIDQCVIEVVKLLKHYAKECVGEEQLKQVALISSNYDQEVADIVIDAFRISGKQGVVNIKRSRTYDSNVTSIKGMNLPMGYRSKDYINDFENEVCDFRNPYVYMTNKKIDIVTDNLNVLLERVAQEQSELLIICKDMDVLVSNMLIQNKRKGAIKVCVVRAPGFGSEQEELLRDIGTVLGMAPFIENEAIDFDEIDPEAIWDYIPRAESVVVSDQNTSITGSDKNIPLMDARADILRAQIGEHTNSYEKSLLQTRISRLTDGIAFINIGSVSEMEFIEKQHRIQDALYAVKSAYSEGVVPGGGAALFSISKMIKFPEDESLSYGFEIVTKAIQMPLIQICENAGIYIEHEKQGFFSRLLDRIMGRTKEYLSEFLVNAMYNRFNYGLNVKSYEVEDMFEAGIIDPVKVTRVALENAASVSGLLLTTECVIVDDKAYEERRYYNE